MYATFFGLREPPFDLTPNPRYLLLTAEHGEALSNLHYGISGQKGITLLIGEAGTGKTTLVRAAMQRLQGPNACCVCLSNPTLTRGEFYESLASAFALPEGTAASKARFLEELTRSITSRSSAGGTTALIIDEAQSLPEELLEELRLLANIELPAARPLPLVLVGQPELAERLNRPSLRQLKQRIALRCLLNPLARAETAAYIATRIRIAGGEPTALFTADAVESIYQGSKGIPRTISVICDNALVSGFALNQRPVGRDVILEVCRDFDIAPASGPGPAGRPAEPRAGVPVDEIRPAPLNDATEPVRERNIFAMFGRRRASPLS